MEGFLKLKISSRRDLIQLKIKYLSTWSFYFNLQVNLISSFIEEDKQYKEQLAEIRSQEFRILEQKVFEKFDQEMTV